MKRLIFICILCGIIIPAGSNSGRCAGNKFVIVYNNMEAQEGLSADWGFAAWIELNGEVYLFDTGGKGDVLSSNLEKLGLDPARVGEIIISHMHWDHIGGLPGISKEIKPNTVVHLPEAADKELTGQMEHLDFQVNSNFKEIGKDIWITSVLENPANQIKEQALVIVNGEKYIILTGCAHPGIVQICEEVAGFFPEKKGELVTGGFHLRGVHDSVVKGISGSIEKLGFEKVAPSHCTGEKAVEIFKQLWGENYTRLNLGDSYSF